MASILLVGQDKERASGIRHLLQKDGHRIATVRSVETWRSREREVLPEIVVASVDSPDRLLSTPGRPMRGFPAPLLFVQHDSDFFRDVFLDDRLIDRITSPFLGQDLLARVDALVRVRRVVHRDRPGSNKRGGSAAAGFAQRMRALLGSRIPRLDKPLGPYLEVAAQVAEWADRRDAFEPGHAERVTSLCAMIADGMGLGDSETSSLLRAAMLHDIGKVAMPVEVLHQKEPLEESQMRLIRTHPERGAALLRALDRDDDVASTILYHHERPDGGGYYGMEGDQIPRAARILAVCEVYDAMTSSRVKKQMPTGEALERMESFRGNGLDAESVNALVAKLRPRRDTIPLAAPR